MKDADARQRQILGDGPRIDRLSGPQFEARAQAVSALLIRISSRAQTFASIDDMTDFVPVMLHNPGMLERMVETGVALTTRGTLPPRDRELAILRTAWLSGAPYEWGEHVLAGRMCGVGCEDVERVITGPEAEGWTTIEQAVLRAVDELIADAMIGDATWAVLAQNYSEAQLIELPMLVGQYQMVAFLQNSLRMRLCEGNEGLTAR